MCRVVSLQIALDRTARIVGQGGDIGARRRDPDLDRIIVGGGFIEILRQSDAGRAGIAERGIGKLARPRDLHARGLAALFVIAERPLQLAVARLTVAALVPGRAEQPFCVARANVVAQAEESIERSLKQNPGPLDIGDQRAHLAPDELQARMCGRPALAPIRAQCRLGPVGQGQRTHAVALPQVPGQRDQSIHLDRVPCPLEYSLECSQILVQCKQV